MKGFLMGSRHSRLSSELLNTSLALAATTAALCCYWRGDRTILEWLLSWPAGTCYLCCEPFNASAGISTLILIDWLLKVQFIWFWLILSSDSLRPALCILELIFWLNSPLELDTFYGRQESWAISKNEGFFMGFGYYFICFSISLSLGF